MFILLQQARWNEESNWNAIVVQRAILFYQKQNKEIEQLNDVFWILFKSSTICWTNYNPIVQWCSHWWQISSVKFDMYQFDVSVIGNKFQNNSNPINSNKWTGARFDEQNCSNVNWKIEASSSWVKANITWALELYDGMFNNRVQLQVQYCPFDN